MRQPGGRNNKEGRESSCGRRSSLETVFAIHHEVGENEVVASPGAGTGQGGVLGAIVSGSTETTQVKIQSLFQDQVQRLLSLIDTPKAGLKKLLGTVSWMLDSGASCHIASNVTMMDEIEK